MRDWGAVLVAVAVAPTLACGSQPSPAPSPSPIEQGWGLPQRLAPETTAWTPALAVDASGNALALWTDLTHVRACHFAPSSGWAAPESLDLSDGQPSVAFDSGGRAIALWTTGPVRLRGLSAGRYEPGVGWGPITPLVPEALTSWPFLGGDLFVRADGTAAVVWRQMVDGQHRIWARRFAPESGWRPAELVGEGRSNASAARVSGDEAGALIVAWHSSDGSAAEVRTARFEPASGWGTVRVLQSTPGSGDQSHPPEVAMSSDGSGFVVWTMRSGSEPPSLWASRYSVAGGWETPQSITVPAVREATLPVVAADGSGSAITVWTQDGGTGDQTWSNRYSPGRGWLGAVILDAAAPSNINALSGPRVAVNSDGVGLAAWTRATLSGDFVSSRAYAARFTPEIGWAAGQPIDSDVTAGQVEVAVGPTGTAVAVWTQGPYPGSQIWANRCAATARP